MSTSSKQGWKSHKAQKAPCAHLFEQAVLLLRALLDGNLLLADFVIDVLYDGMVSHVFFFKSAYKLVPQLAGHNRVAAGSEA